MKIKDLIIYLSAVLILGITSYVIQSNIISIDTQPHYTLSNLHLLLGVFSLILGGVIYFLFLYFEKYIGVAFLAISFIKLLFLVGIYKGIFFNEAPIEKIILLHFLIPFFIYLLLEVGLTAKHLNKMIL